MPTLLATVLVGGLLTSGPTAVHGQADTRWEVSPSPEVAIGQVAGDEVYEFESVEFARFLLDGRIAVADDGPHVVRVYGPEGRFQTEMGGEGEGPREFRNIKGMWLTEDGGIAVFGAANRRITVFHPDGELLASQTVAPAEGTALPSGNLNVFLGSFSNGDALLAWLSFGSEPGERGVSPDPWLLGRVDLNGRLRARLGEIRGMRRAGRRPVPYSAMPRVSVHGDFIYIADGYDAEIKVLRGDGSRVRTIQLPSRPVSADDPWTSLKAELRQMGPIARLSLENLEKDRVPKRERFPQVAHLLTDDAGYLWVKDYQVPDDSIWLQEKGALWPAPGGQWRIVAPSGRLTAVVRMPGNVIPLDIQGDRLLGLTHGRLGVERIAVHEIER